MTADDTPRPDDQKSTPRDVLAGGDVRDNKPDDADKGDEKPNDLEAMERALKKANKEAEQYRLKVKEFEDASKSEQEKLTERLKEQEARAAKAERDALRLKVALDKGLPKTLASRLQGDTEDELMADADELLSTVGTTKRTPDFDGGARTPPPSDDDMNALIRQRAGRG